MGLGVFQSEGPDVSGYQDLWALSYGLRVRGSWGQRALRPSGIGALGNYGIMVLGCSGLKV